MKTAVNEESPFCVSVSFEKYLKVLEVIRDSDTQEYRARYAASLIENMAFIPELRGEIIDFSILGRHEDLIHLLLADIFPTGLTFNEIKAASVPLTNITFNYTERFKNILKDAGENFNISYRKIHPKELYVYSCCLILQQFFRKDIKVSIPLYYDIPSRNGVIKHYKITVNSDYTTISPTRNAVFPNESEISMLLENMDDLKLWKKYFPPQSWTLSGFNIISLVDATTEVALSDLKSALIEIDPQNLMPNHNLKEIFRSYFDAPELNFGLMLFNRRNNSLEKIKVYENIFTNHILDFWLGMFDEKTRKATFQNIAYNSKPIIVTNVDDLEEEVKALPSFQILKSNNIRSFMVIPIIKDSELLAILEVTSPVADCLDGLKLKKLEFIFDIIVYSLKRFNFEKDNQIEAIIQQEYTAIHESVAWKFRAEAEKKYNALLAGKKYALREISFSGLVPLFGQTDIRASSEKRQECLAGDLKQQTIALSEIFETADNETSEKFLMALDAFREELSDYIRADTEQRFQHFLRSEIAPQLLILENSGNRIVQQLLKRYQRNTFHRYGVFYNQRKLLDDSITIINRKLSEILEKKQEKAQQIFPHYFEMFKSDGVEYNLFIGPGIAPELPFDKSVVRKLKIWQLETLSRMEKSVSRISGLPYPLEVASLIFAYNDTIEIRFRMDEKRFDVDGAYNSYYEIIKKRLEKAFVKGSKERLTQPGKITIVYLDEDSGKDYLEMVKKLQKKKILSPETEMLEVEDMQGVSGLKAIRISSL